MHEPNLVLLDTHGVYIPQLYCSDADEQWAKDAGVDYSDVQICQAGPDHEWYWRLHQEGDLWEVPEGYEWPED
jgi:hypothetical protein